MISKKHGLLFHILDVVLNIAIIVAVVVAIRTFLVSPFEVEGSSMSDTLQDHEYIIINKLVYFLGAPERGDIVVFYPPNDSKKHYVKRVIGLPGDTISIRNGNVYITPRGSTEERKLDEPYLNPSNQGSTYRHPQQEENGGESEITVPEGEYFVMGDNRKGSLDSRSFGPVAENAIKGRVWIIALPISKIQAISPQEYGLQ